MPYIAHVGICLANDYPDCEKDEWVLGKTINDISFYWRLSAGYTYEVVCMLFDDKYKALTAAKELYCAVLYNLLRRDVRIKNAGCAFYEKRLYHFETDGDKKDYPESSFFWTPKNIGGGLGPDVYEVPGSLDDFDKLYSKRGLHVEFKITTPGLVLDFDNFNSAPFCYNQESQPLLATIVEADTVLDIGLKMTLYCGLLEHISDNARKSEAVLSEIDALMQHVAESSLKGDEKESLLNYLREGKEISARQKCLRLCEKYAKEKYGQHPIKKIFDDAYSIRSAYSHGEDCGNRYFGPASYIKLVVLDVLKGYINDKEAPHA